MNKAREEYIERQLDVVEIYGKKLRDMTLEECQTAIVMLDDAITDMRSNKPVT